MRAKPFAIAVLILPLVMQSLSARAAEVKYFHVQAGDHPHDVAPAPDGTVWYTGQLTGVLGRLDPKTGGVERIPLGKGSAPHGVIVGPDEASRHTSGSDSCITRRMGSGVFTPMPHPLMIPSSRILDKAGKALLSAIANCSCQGVESNLLSDEMSCTNTMSSRLSPIRCKLSSIERHTPSAV